MKRALRAPTTIGRPELLIDGSDDAFRELVHDLFALGTRHERIRSGHAARIGLSSAGYTVLIAVAHLATNGSVLTKDIAEHLHVTNAFVTMETTKLVQSGLLTKLRSAHDSRVVEISLTEQGRDLLDRLAPTQRRVNDQQFAELTAEEFGELRRLVRLLIENSDRAVALQTYLAATEPGLSHD